MVMKRYPNGITGKFFFMKRTPANRPERLTTRSIAHKSGNVIDFPIVQDLASLLRSRNAKELLAVVVPGGKREHATSARSQFVDPPLLVAAQQHFRVAFGAKSAAGLVPLFAEFDEVVDAALNTSPTSPSSDTIGWRPNSLKSIMASRRCPNAACGQLASPSASGPRRASCGNMLSTRLRFRSEPVALINPAVPHIASVFLKRCELSRRGVVERIRGI